MRDTELFQAALGLSSPWIVLRSEFDPDQKQLDLQIGFARGSRFACPACGAEGCSVHDVREKEWRHLNFFQHKTVLKASIPRVSCLQDVFTMPSVASARKFLHRWHAWVSTCDLQPMKKVAVTIMARADEILRSLPDQAQPEADGLPHRRRSTGRSTHLKQRRPRNHRPSDYARRPKQSIRVSW